MTLFKTDIKINGCTVWLDVDTGHEKPRDIRDQEFVAFGAARALAGVLNKQAIFFRTEPERPQGTLV